MTYLADLTEQYSLWQTDGHVHDRGKGYA